MTNPKLAIALSIPPHLTIQERVTLLRLAPS
jgi:hypothetical protein